MGASAPSPAASAFRMLVVAANDCYHGAMSDAAHVLATATAGPEPAHPKR